MLALEPMAHDVLAVPSWAAAIFIALPMPKKIKPLPGVLTKALEIRKYDHAISVLVDIETLAKLLEAVGSRIDAEPLDSTVVSMTGNMITRRADDLRKVLKTAHQIGQE